MPKRILVTAALPYANGPLHLGHLAGAYLPSDLYVRFKRLEGTEVLFICGSDEHGVPITIAADKEGVSPQQIVDRYHEINKAAFEQFGISFDYYGRTSSKTHRKISQDFFSTLYNKGIFKQKKDQQFYDEKAGMFLADRYIKGTCPKCGYEEAYGDQCEKCGTSLSPTELINPYSALSGEKPVMKETEHWYIPLGDFQDWLTEWIDGQEDWKSNVVGQCKSWLASGLGDRAVTRDLSWGVPVPLKNAEGKVLYVWFDAPIGYISSTVEWAAESGDPEAWKLFWQDDETELIHFIGKDNIVFHCIMFPAMLKAHGDFILPKNVPANEFLNLEGKKLSTSRGWAVWLHEYLEDFDSDLLRYALASTLPESKDSDFSWKDFQGRINNDLADVLGNFIFRTCSFTQRFFEGNVPELVNPTNQDIEMLDFIEQTKKEVAESYNKFRFKDAAQQSIQLARVANKYFTDMQPWHTRKTDIVTCGNTLHVCIQTSAALSVLLEPIVPKACAKLRDIFGISRYFDWESISKEMIKAGEKIKEVEIPFKKIEDEHIQAQITKLEEKAQAAASKQEKPTFAPEKDAIDFDDFAKLDLRVAKVIHAEKVKKSKKLIKLELDLGYETRTVLSGIAEYHEAESLPGKNVVVVANLKPRVMMGIESKGMVLMADDPEKGLLFVSTDSAPGSTVN